MVRHGKDKKRRAGRYGKTKQKNKNFRRWNPNPKIPDKVVKQLWDTTKTPLENMALMGFAANANKNDTKANNNNNNKANNNSIIELFDVPDSDNPKERRVLPLTQEEQEYMSKCMTKHGNDYGKMFRDIRVNDLQLTETKLQKLGSRFLLLEDHQRLVEVPPRVQHLTLQKGNQECQ